MRTTGSAGWHAGTVVGAIPRTSSREPPATSTSTTMCRSRTPTCQEGGDGTLTGNEEYANYLEDPAHLVAISVPGTTGRKGARGPEEWAPPDNNSVVPVRFGLDGDKATVGA